LDVTDKEYKPMRLTSDKGSNFFSKSRDTATALRIVSDARRIEETLPFLTLVSDEQSDEINPGYQRWEYYNDARDASIWLYCVPALEPLPGDETLISGEIIFENLVACIENSQYDDEISAVGALLNSPECFEPLLVRLENLFETKKSLRVQRNIAIALASSAVSTPYNYRGCAGKTIAQIEEDYAYFVRLAERANAIREHAELAIGERIVSWGGTIYE
jgi:hypothetical protein